ncbi:MAG TPA: ABC transporter substrate-binding protein [Terriglobales bacterium]|nr:ABC transporter substrate-binding protein [Terriglobales bacterium]
MKRLSLLSIALTSLAFATAALAATRPHYGGTLHIAIQEAPQTFDTATSDSPGFRSLTQLVFENLVKLDDHARPQPWLATSWQVEPGNQRWRFQVRSGVIFSDGTPLDTSGIAASLRAGNPQWKIFALGELVMIETESADPNVAAELALPRNAIVRRANGAVFGTGPFTVAQWDSAKHVTLAANNQYWNGRPFLDSLEVDLGKAYRDQLMQFDLGKADLVEVAPESIRTAQAGNRNVITSAPEELLCLVFARDPQSDAEAQVRAALARNIDTTALNNVVFQAGGEPTGALLPNWLSGYAFIFPPGTNEARHQRVFQPISWTLAYDNTDPVSRIVAERITLNARDIGITLQAGASGSADIRIVRIPLPSLDAEISLSMLSYALQLPPPKLADASLDALYSAESALLQTHRVIPLLHLRSAIAVRSNLHGAALAPDATWHLQNAWLGPENP